MSVALLVVEDISSLRDLVMDFLSTFVDAGELLVGKSSALADGVKQSVRAITTQKNDTALILGVEDYDSAVLVIKSCRDNGVPVGLVVTDGQFPGGNGAKLIKEHVGSDTPWVAVTGDMGAWAVNAQECGLHYASSRVLKKPYTGAMLLRTIHNAIEHPRMSG